MTTFKRNPGLEYSDLPFFRLVKLFLSRIFYGGGDTGAEELGLGMGAALALLALPGGFISLLLFDKYGSLLRIMRGQTDFDDYAAAVPDEYFFIVLSMVVTGALVTWRWDSIFPDRRDYANLVALPLSMGAIFFANLVAILLLTALFALDINAGSAVLFPIVVSASQETFLYFGSFALVHALTVILASAFSCVAVFGTVGALLSVLPYRAFRRISLYVRWLTLTSLLAMLSTSFAVPSMLRDPARKAGPIQWLPSVWFLGLFQWMRGRANFAEVQAAKTSLYGMGAALTLMLIGYAISYRRCFMQIPETLDVTAENAPRMLSISRIFDRAFLRNGPERACFHFVCKTLFRSERHCVALAAFVGMGAVIASQVLFSSLRSGGVSHDGVPSAEILAVPLTVSYCGLVGLQFVFQMPTELRANWTFRLLLDVSQPYGQVVARKVMLSFVLPALLAIGLPAYMHYWGWITGLSHIATVTLWSWLLTEVLLLRFRKIPFTCSYPAFESNAIAIVLIYLIGFYGFAVLTPKIEAAALLFPPIWALLVPVPLGTLWIVSRLRRDRPEVDQQLIFEDIPTGGFELLALNE